MDRPGRRLCPAARSAARAGEPGAPCRVIVLASARRIQPTSRPARLLLSCSQRLQRQPQPREVALTRPALPGPRMTPGRAGSPSSHAGRRSAQSAGHRGTATRRPPGPVRRRCRGPGGEVAVDRVAPQRHQPVGQRMPYAQACRHRRDLRPRLPPAASAAAACPAVRTCTSAPAAPGRRRQRGEPQPGHPWPQLADQVQRRLELAVVQQPRHYQQRGLLRDLHPVPAPSQSRSSSCLPGIAQVPQVEPLPVRRPGGPSGGARPARSCSPASQRRSARNRPVANPPCATSSVTHAGVPATGVRDPTVRCRRHPGQHRPPPGDLYLRPRPGLRASGGGQAVDRPLQLADRVHREAAMPAARPTSGSTSSHAATPRSDLEAGLEPAPSRSEQPGALPLSYSKMPGIRPPTWRQGSNLRPPGYSRGSAAELLHGATGIIAIPGQEAPV